MDSPQIPHAEATSVPKQAKLFELLNRLLDIGSGCLGFDGESIAHQLGNLINAEFVAKPFPD